LAVDSIPKDRDRLKLNQTTLAYDHLKNTGYDNFSCTVLILNLFLILDKLEAKGQDKN
jgi:hypothetical protein